MILRTEHNRFGVIELEENRIDFCYQPDFLDEFKNLEKVSMDNLIEINGALGIGGYVTKELKEQITQSFITEESNNIIHYPLRYPFQISTIHCPNNQWNHLQQFSVLDISHGKFSLHHHKT